MGEYSSKKDLDSKVFTGSKVPLCTSLASYLDKAEEIDIIVSFILESGVRRLLPFLKTAKDRKVPIRILTGRYLSITEPSALALLMHELSSSLDIRFYDKEDISFHPKSYFIKRDGKYSLFIGSSNISESALVRGLEWNYRLDEEIDEESIIKFHEEFVRLFATESIKIDQAVLEEYSRSWVKPEVVKVLDQAEEESEIVVPKGAQIEALLSLEDTREKGFDRALVTAATGIGKTYLSAFDSQKYERVLFVAHRIEILNQAYKSFKKVRGEKGRYGFFSSEKKDTDVDVLFASVQTLGQEGYLDEAYFSPDYFDYIIIDEFHHAVNKAYVNIINYFKPKFLLGLTATPDRFDRRDIYILCNYNVPYSITLKEGIEKGMLVPFRYYGIYDDIDYSSVRRINGRYSESELTSIYKTSIERKELIFKHYKKHDSTRALAFCCSIKHAEDMASYFNEHKVKAVSVSSNSKGEFSLDRDRAIERLKSREIDIIFSVDMFNEGLDIAELDTVLFLRPTESPVVFLQQLGRGLRLSEGKEYLTVLDFIGNYVNAGRLPELLSGVDGEGRQEIALTSKTAYPKGCIVDFDLKLIDLFERMKRNSMTREERILEDLKAEYNRIRSASDRSLTAIEFFTSVDMSVFSSCYGREGWKNRKAIPTQLQNFLRFKQSVGDLEQDEERLLGTIAEDFLTRIGILKMDKSYKMPILLAFYNDGNIKMGITKEDVIRSYKDFYFHDGNWRDLESNASTRNFRSWKDDKFFSEAKKNPITMMSRSDEFFFIPEDDNSYVLVLNEILKAFISNEAFIRQFKGMIDFRSALYYRANY